MEISSFVRRCFVAYLESTCSHDVNRVLNLRSKDRRDGKWECHSAIWRLPTVFVERSLAITRFEFDSWMDDARTNETLSSHSFGGCAEKLNKKRSIHACVSIRWHKVCRILLRICFFCNRKFRSSLDLWSFVERCARLALVPKTDEFSLLWRTLFVHSHGTTTDTMSVKLNRQIHLWRQVKIWCESETRVIALPKMVRRRLINFNFHLFVWTVIFGKSIEMWWHPDVDWKWNGE